MRSILVILFGISIVMLGVRDLHRAVGKYGQGHQIENVIEHFNGMTFLEKEGYRSIGEPKNRKKEEEVEVPEESRGIEGFLKTVLP